MNLNEIYDALKIYMDASQCVNADANEKAQEAMRELEKYCWKPIMDPDERDGYGYR